MTNANAANVSESILYMEETYAVTFRPNEYKTVTCEGKRMPYGNLTVVEQKMVLLTCIDHFIAKKIPLTGIFYETQEHPTKGTLVHFHATFKSRTQEEFKCFYEHAQLLNKRYGLKDYKALDYKFLATIEDEHRWIKYKMKDVIKNCSLPNDTE